LTLKYPFYKDIIKTLLLKIEYNIMGGFTNKVVLLGKSIVGVIIV